MRLIIFTGLPGTGKSLLAESIGKIIGVPVFAKDWLEATLLRSGLGKTSTDRKAVGYAGYELLSTLAQRQLSLEQSVILDSVASFERIRKQWRELAAQYHAQWYVIECICSVELLHRQRLSSRKRSIPGWHELDWTAVKRVKNYYEPWHEERLILDAIQPLADNIQRTRAYLERPTKNT